MNPLCVAAILGVLFAGPPWSQATTGVVPLPAHVPPQFLGVMRMVEGALPRDLPHANQVSEGLLHGHHPV